MEAEFIEKYFQLKDMKTGNIAVSKDRTKIFLCVNVWDNNMKENKDVIINLNDLYSNYNDKFDMQQPIRFLKKDDKFIIKV